MFKIVLLLILYVSGILHQVHIPQVASDREYHPPPILELINSTRASYGLPELPESRQLNELAQLRISDNVPGLDYHQGLSRRLLQSSVRDGDVGEILGRAYTAENMLQLWMDSPSHRAIILGTWDSIGAAVHEESGMMWTVVEFYIHW